MTGSFVLDIGTFVDYDKYGPGPVERRIRAVDGPGRTTEPCCCGGVIEANEATWEAVADAVRWHQRGVRHTAWQLGVELAS